uniref:Uncharacterized protein n=1 Tax=Arundo donax TaxID=35708 RepID=A0A0A9U2W9_ARUDO
METGAVAIWDPRSLLRDFEMGSSSGATVIEDYFAPKESLHFDVTTTNLVNGAAPSTLEFTLIEDYFSPEGPSAPRILTTTGDLARARSGAEGLRIIEDYFSPDGPPAPGILSTTSPATWSESESDTPSMVALLLRHSDPVRGLTFSSQTPGFLASGAAHGKITVWDLANPSVENIPTLEFTEGDNVNISDLSWSPLMPCTISSASNVGAAIWDLNVNSPLIRKLPWMRKCTAIEWSPSNKNLMVVAARDFCDLPAVKVWDLRRMDRPVLQFCEDTKGVLALSWCPFDEDILAACTNDEKILILNAKKGEIVEEMTAPGTCFDIRWSKNLEDHFAISSSEQVDLYYRAPEI